MRKAINWWLSRDIARHHVTIKLDSVVEIVRGDAISEEIHYLNRRIDDVSELSAAYRASVGAQIHAKLTNLPESRRTRKLYRRVLIECLDVPPAKIKRFPYPTRSAT